MKTGKDVDNEQQEGIGSLTVLYMTLLSTYSKANTSKCRWINSRMCAAVSAAQVLQIAFAIDN